MQFDLCNGPKFDRLYGEEWYDAEEKFYNEFIMKKNSRN